MPKRIPESVKNLLYPLFAVGVLMLFWYLLALGVDKELIVPSPRKTFGRLGVLLRSSGFYAAVGGTFLRSVESFALSAVCALGFALLSAFFVVFRRFFAPIVTVLRAVPTMSVILLSVVWLKASFSPILVAFLIAFPVLYAGFLSAFLSVDPKLVELSAVYRVPLRKRITGLYLPSVLPSALDSLGATASLNVKIVISAEVLAATADSIGQSMQLNKIYLETSELLAWTLVAVLISYLFEALFWLIKRIFVRWQR